MHDLIWTFLVSMLPIIEIRGAIPLGVSLGLSVELSFILGFLGNMLALSILFAYLEPVSIWLRQNFDFFERFFSWLFERTRSRYGASAETVSELFLFFFVAIPLPGTGAWSAALIVFVFGLPKKHTFISITLGIFMAGVLIASAIAGVSTIF